MAIYNDDKGKLIVVSSGKGGVGKTTTSLNLSCALAKMGKDVILVDANLTTPNLGLHLGMANFPITFSDVLAGDAQLEEALYKLPYGFRLLPGSLSLRSFGDINLKKLEVSLEELRDMAEFIIIDSAAGLGNEAVSVLKHADEIIIVSNPELPALTDAYKVITLVRELDRPLVKGVVLNKARRQDTHDISVKGVETLLEIPVSSIIQENKRMREALHKKKPYSILEPRSSTAKQYYRLASKVSRGDYSRRIEELQEENSFLKSLLGLFGF